VASLVNTTEAIVLAGLAAFALGFFGKPGETAETSFTKQSPGATISVGSGTPTGSSAGGTGPVSVQNKDSQDETLTASSESIVDEARLVFQERREGTTLVVGQRFAGAEESPIIVVDPTLGGLQSTSPTQIRKSAELIRQRKAAGLSRTAIPEGKITDLRDVKLLFPGNTFLQSRETARIQRATQRQGSAGRTTTRFGSRPPVHRVFSNTIPNTLGRAVIGLRPR